MKSIRYIDQDTIEIRGPGVPWRRVFFAGVAALGLAAILVPLSRGLNEENWKLLLAGAFLLPFGLGFSGKVQRFVYNRASGKLTHRWGFLRSRHERMFEFTPRAIQITSSRDWEGYFVHRLYLVHERGRKLLFERIMFVDPLRRQGEALAEFLGVDCFFDRQYTYQGLLGSQRDPAAQPTRTNLSTGKTQRIAERDQDIEELETLLNDE